MTDIYRKPVIGEPFVPSARQTGAFIDAAQQVQQLQRQLGAAKKPRGGPAYVLVRNDTGGDLNIPHAVVGLDAPVQTPDDADALAYGDPLVSGAVPDADTHTGKFAILTGPVGEDGIQPGVVSGQSWVRLLINDDAHEFADVEEGETGRLQTAETGSALILSKEGYGEGQEVWALVRLSNPSSPTTDTGSGSTSAGCGCSCIDAEDAPVDVHGCDGPLVLAMSAVCGQSEFLCVWVSGTTWRSASRNITCGETETCVYLEIVSTGLAPGEQTATLKDDSDDSTLKTWDGAHGWNPRCPLRMVIQGSGDCECDYVSEPCLRPWIASGTGVECVDGVPGEGSVAVIGDEHLVIDCGGDLWPCKFGVPWPVSGLLFEYDSGCTWVTEDRTTRCGNNGHYEIAVSGGVMTMTEVDDVEGVIGTWISVGPIDPHVINTLVLTEQDPCGGDCEDAPVITCVYPVPGGCVLACGCEVARTYHVTMAGNTSGPVNATCDVCANADYSLTHGSLHVPPSSDCIWQTDWELIGDVNCTLFHERRAVLNRLSAVYLRVTFETRNGVGGALAAAIYELHLGSTPLGCEGPWELALVSSNGVLTDACVNWPATITVT